MPDATAAPSALTVMSGAAMLDGMSCAVTPTTNASAKTGIRRRFKTVAMREKTRSQPSWV